MGQARRGHPGRVGLRSGLLAVVFVIGAAGCIPVTAPPPDPPRIWSSPALFPAFSTSVSDYVVRCTSGTPVVVRALAPSGTTVTVDGQVARGRNFAARIPTAPGQSFSIDVQSSTGTTTHHVRCLPSDYPTWTVQKLGPTQAEFYEVAAFRGTYPTIFDSNGVPVWWVAPPGGSLYAQLLPDGNFSWMSPAGEAVEVGFDGTVLHTITPAGSGADWHDLAQLPNGDFGIVVNSVRTNVDLAAVWGSPYPSSANVLDQIAEEITPAGSVVWSWDAMDHISLTETDPQFRAAKVNGAYDALHWNSIEWTGSGFLLSFRHLGAVYDVDESTGLRWKVGGTARAESLQVIGDPVFTGGGGFSGQHDARLSNGILTLFDNGTKASRPPRALRYQIDTAAGTATLLDDEPDSLVTASICCGSARHLSGGDWVVGWGGGTTATEMTATGTRVFVLDFGFSGGAVLYRALPVAPGVLSLAALRAGMDAQYGSAASRARSTSGPAPAPSSADGFNVP